MDLLGMLTGAMTSGSSVNALSEKTGTSSEQTSSLISAALPILLGALTNNASSEEGAQSLLGALGQHTSTASMAEQLQNADAVDGEKIVEHILGGNTASVIEALSGQTGASTTQVHDLLNNMAPAMMSGVSAANTSAANTAADSKPDFSALLGAFGGEEAADSGSNILGNLLGGGDNGSQSPIGELVGGLFGNNSAAAADTNTFNGGSLLSLLGSFMNK